MGGSWLGNLRERDHLEDPGLDGRIILNGSARNGRGMDWIDVTQHKEVTSPCQRGSEPSDSKNCGDFLD